MLEGEGFANEGYFDIFDGGPTMTARTDRVKSIAEARHVKVARVCPPDNPKKALAATGHLPPSAAPSRKSGRMVTG
jgi:arginine N-succinyltransferase